MLIPNWLAIGFLFIVACVLAVVGVYLIWSRSPFVFVGISACAMAGLFFHTLFKKK